MKHVFGNFLCRGFYGKYLYLEGLSDVAYKPMQAPIKPPERFVLRLTASTPRAISIQWLPVE